MTNLKNSRKNLLIVTIMVGMAVLFSTSLPAAAGEAVKGKKVTFEEKLQQVWDRQEIEQLMYRHARSLDRMDAELMKDCYWPEGIEEHQDPIYPELFHWNDNAWKFVPVAMEGFSHLKITQHRISNVLIELDGDKATAETYVWAYHIGTENGVDREGILGGRHHFRLEKRNNEWRIMHRSTIFDWNQNRDATAIWSDNFSKKYRPERNHGDDSYNYVGGKNK